MIIILLNCDILNVGRVWIFLKNQTHISSFSLFLGCDFKGKFCILSISFQKLGENICSTLRSEWSFFRFHAWLVLNRGLNGQKTSWSDDVTYWFHQESSFLVTRWKRRGLTVVLHSLEAVLCDSLRLTVGVSCLISLCIFYSHSVVQQTHTFFNRRRREK